MQKTTPPTNITELKARAEAIAGLSLAQVAEQYDYPLPQNLSREKGWQGQLLEYVLGADAASKPEPDFTQLGIELKTLPINAQGKPLESTFVSVIPLLDIHKQTWQISTVYKKLQHVLWVPIIAEPGMRLMDRRVATPLLWRPDHDVLHTLQQDWEQLVAMISMGRIEEVTARHGQYLQVRPKGASSKSLTYGLNSEGDKVLMLPRGFYLRSKFTQQILTQNFLI